MPVSDAIREAFARVANRLHELDDSESLMRDCDTVKAALQSSQTAPAVPELRELVKQYRDAVDYSHEVRRNSHSSLKLNVALIGQETIERQIDAMLNAPAADAGKALPVAIPDRDFDETDPIHQAADAYSYACEIVKQYQTERVEAGKEPGTAGSLCDGIAWLYQRIQELENHSPDAGKVVKENAVMKYTSSATECHVEWETLPYGTHFLYTRPAESREEIQAQALDDFSDDIDSLADRYDEAGEHGRANSIREVATLACQEAARLRASQQEGGEG